MTTTAAESAFARFTDPYKAYGDKIQMKIDHTLRVRDLCEDIAESIGLCDGDIELAAICGLLHDIGRFEQFGRYGTYNDSRSVDHGDLGAELLEDHDLICSFSPTNHDTIVNAVRYHNKYRIPDTLSDKDALFARIVRDADKLDILRSLATGVLSIRSKNTAMSEPVLNAVLNRRSIRKQELETKADNIAMCLAFTFDLQFERSLEILKENGSIDMMIRRHMGEAESEELRAQLEMLQGHFLRCLEEGSNLGVPRDAEGAARA